MKVGNIRVIWMFRRFIKNTKIIPEQSLHTEQLLWATRFETYSDFKLYPHCSIHISIQSCSTFASTLETRIYISS